MYYRTQKTKSAEIEKDVRDYKTIESCHDEIQINDTVQDEK